MSVRLFYTFLTLILISLLFLSNAYTQDYTQWELPDGAIARIGKGGIRGIQYASDGRFLAVASSLGIWIYDTGTLQETALFTGGTEGMSCMALSPDGRTFAIGSRNGNIYLSDRVTGVHKTTLIGHTEGIFSISFSPDGGTIASGSSDSTIRLWNADTGEQKTTFSGDRGRVFSVAFSPDGETVISGSEDGTVRLWDADTGDTENSACRTYA